VEDRILVTGADGFVGRHLMAQLGRAGVDAAADVTDVDHLRDAIRAAAPRAVVHLAARSSAGASWSGGADIWHVNALGTVNVLDAVAAAAPRARVLVVSSGEVYGETAERPAREDDPVAPLSPYAASKAAAEIAALRAARADGLDVVVVRTFSHTGPGQDERFAVGSWTAQIARLEAAGGGALLVGDVSVRRDLTDVRDVCRAYRVLLEPGVAPGVYNIASGQNVRLADVVETLVRMATSPISVERDAARLRPADVRILVGDPSRVRAATGWRPEISLEQTLADALADARKRVASNEAVPA
jgi:GDP-4-dehydro-6-deoxy-D-mannose reductase